jgi:hypothetical protein
MGNQRRKAIYLGLAGAGLILPYWQFAPWVAQNGINMRLFAQQLFANRISGFFAMDVLVSAVVAIMFIRSEGARLGMRRLWAPIVAICAVGVSLGLPLFLYMRESLDDPGKD